MSNVEIKSGRYPWGQKPRIFRLRNGMDNYVAAEFRVDESSEASVSGRCHIPYEWDMDGNPTDSEYLADVYCKWDSCTHWYFRGEDYGDTANLDGYYHICGETTLLEHIRAMCFVWQVAADLFREHHGEDYDPDYYENVSKDLVDFMLVGYKIQEVTEPSVEEVRETLKEVVKETVEKLKE